MTGDSYLSPYVYTNIINSEEFSLKLLNEELVNSNADKFTVKEYLLSEKVHSILILLDLLKNILLDYF